MFTSNINFNPLKYEFQQKNKLMYEFTQVYARIEGEKVEIERKMVNADMKKIENEMDRFKINNLYILVIDTSNMNPR